MPDGELKLSLYELEQGLSEALAAADENADAGLLEIVKAYFTAAVEKRDRVARFLKHLESQEELAVNEIRRLQDRKVTIQNAQKRVKANVVRVMELLQVKKLEGETSTFTLRQNPSRVEILDENLIPARFVTIKTETVPDKKAIAAAIKLGEEVPGCDLLFGEMGVTIK